MRAFIAIKLLSIGVAASTRAPNTFFGIDLTAQEQEICFPNSKTGECFNNNDDLGISLASKSLLEKFQKRLPTLNHNPTTGYVCPPELSFPKNTGSSVVEDKESDDQQQFSSGLNKIYNFDEDTELENQDLTKEVSYGQFILDARKLRDALLHFHGSLKCYVCSDGPNFERFVEDYPKLNTEFSLMGLAVLNMRQRKSMFGEKVKNYYNKVSTMFHLLEILGGMRLKGHDASASVSEIQVSQTPQMPQKVQLKAMCSNLVDIEIYLSGLVEAHRKYQFHPGGFEIGVELANRRFETTKDESQDLFSDVPLNKVTEEDIFRIEEALERLNRIRKPHLSTSSNDRLSETHTMGEEGESLSTRIYQRFDIMYLTDRLRFVRDCLAEIADSAALGFNLYEAVAKRLQDICNEVKTQFEALEISSKRSKRLLEYLLQVTIFKMKEMDEISIFDPKPLTSKSTAVKEDTTNPNSGNYHFHEVDGVKAELENSLAILKKIKDDDLIKDPENFNEAVVRNIRRWREMCACLQRREWYWQQEASLIKLMECEISAILLTMQNFSHENYSHKRRGNSTKTEQSDSGSQTVSDEETGVDYIEESSGNFWSKWGCCR